MSVESLLLDGSAQLGINLNDSQINKFLAYIDLIKKWNSRINLTSITTDKEIVLKHFIDSLTVSEYIHDDSSAIDIGTGAGFPSIPLAIVREKVNFTALDSREKRIFFLNEVVRELGINNVKTVASRAEDYYKKGSGNNFDYVLTRAVGDIGDVINLSVPYLNKSGKIILMRGSEGKTEWENYSNCGYSLLHLNEIELPGSNIKRVLIVIKHK